MFALESICVSSNMVLRDAANLIQKSEIKALLVCCDGMKLLGTVTDGDIRRAVSNGLGPYTLVGDIMGSTPRVARMDESVTELRQRMRKEVLTFLPRVDEAGRVQEIVLLHDTIGLRPRNTQVVLMAGGKGKRLLPLTRNIPKPLLDVGGRPVLEHQIRQLKEFGLTKFHLTVNYLADMVRDYFGDGSQFGVEISYIEEKAPLGTVGALAALAENQVPLLVMNGDILAKADFGMMTDLFHSKNVAATVGVREYQYTVPYGCVDIDDGFMTSVSEKPTYYHLINAGIYVLSPEALSMIPKDTFFDMPDLLQMLLEHGMKVNTFLITDEWIDIGHKADLDWARKVYAMEQSGD